MIVSHVQPCASSQIVLAHDDSDDDDDDDSDVIFCASSQTSVVSRMQRLKYIALCLQTPAISANAFLPDLTNRLCHTHYCLRGHKSGNTSLKLVRTAKSNSGP